MKLHSRLRAALLRGTMLLSPALVVSGAAMAQSIPANTRPQGGQVVGGSAAIAQGATTTTITQSTNRAIIDWRSFSVGRDQSVQFQQPSAASMTLNRVTGPDPSVIAGRVTANGGIALVNQSGVFFAGGSQVSAQSVIVSTADISNAGFMAGGAMRFDQPGKPDARIDNAGTITVKQAGLAALVAPQVANRGVIQANLATVVLGGAQRHVIDINGDGLVSFDITDAVRTRPADGGALVSNTGAISAQGGTVLLTAQAADGIVQSLVRAGGTISAGTDAATGRTGQVLFTGTGGSISVEGAVDVSGTAPGTRGGSITVAAERVLVAAPARLDASGAAGGGAIAIGIVGGGVKAERIGIAAGAILRADATGLGKGGQIDVKAKNMAIQAGTLTARGGPAGGDGGTIAISSAGGLQLGGVIDTGAPAGLAGQVIIDPQFLTIVADGDGRANVPSGDLTDLILAGGDAPTNAFITAGQIAAIGGDLTLQATDTITVAAAVTKPAGGLALETGGTLTIDAPLVLVAGDLILTAQTMAINELVQVSGANQVVLNPIGRIGGGSVTEAGAGRIVGGVLTSALRPAFDDITLNGDNRVARIDTLAATNTLAFTNVVDLLVAGIANGANSTHIDVRGGNLTIDGTVTSAGAPDSVQLRASGNLALTANGIVTGSGIAMSAAFDFAAGTADPRGAGGMTLAGSVIGVPFFSAGSILVNSVRLAAGTGGITQTSGVVQAGTLAVNSGGNATLTSVQTGFAGSNQIDILAASNVAGDFSLSAYKLASGGSIGIGGSLLLSDDIVVGGTLTLAAMNSGLQQLTGSRIVAAGLNASTAAFGITFGGDNRVAALGTLSSDGLIFRNVIDLNVAGTVASGNDLAITVAGGNLLVTGGIVTLGGDLVLVASGNVNVAASAVLASIPSDGGGILIIRAATPDSGFDPTLPGGITLAGQLSANLLAFYAGTSGIVQTAGRLQADELTLRSGGVALLNGASTPNAISDSLSDVEAAGNFALDNGSTPLDVTGQIRAANVTLVTSAALQLSEGCLSFGGSCSVTPATIDAGAGRVSFQANSIAFTNAGNLVTAGLVEIAPFGVGNGLVAGGATGSSVAGAISVNQDVLARITATTLRLGATTPGGTTAQAVQLVGPVAFAGTLDLRSLGNITQTIGAPLAVGTLTGAAAGAIQLTAPANAIGAVGDLAAGGAVDLTVAGAMTLTGLLSAPGQTVTLVAGTGIAETGAGRIAAGTLAAQSTAGNIALAGGNVVDVLGNVTAAGDFTFNDTAPLLTVAAGATVAATGVAITTAGALALAGVIDGTEVDLNAGTGIAGTGIVAAGTLTASTAAGDISLTGFNRVDALGNVSTPGSFTFNDDVRIVTVLAGATVGAGGGVSITDTGIIVVSGLISSPGQTVALSAESGINGAGAIAAGTLTAQTDIGDITLTGANVVGALGDITTPGSVTFNDIAPLMTVAAGATVAAGTGITLTGTGAFAIAGNLSTPGQTVGLAAGTGISGAGIITAALLNAQSTAGDIALTGANVVDAIGAISTPGAFTFNDTVAVLTVASDTAISTGGGISLTDTGAIVITGDLAAPGQSILLAAGTDISGAGVLTAASLTATAATGSIALTGANQVAALSTVSARGSLTFNDAVALLTISPLTSTSAGGDIAIGNTGAILISGALAAPGQTVSLIAGTGISGDGIVTAETLNARSTSGDILLSGGNRVNAIGILAAPGMVAFSDDVALLTIGAETTIAAGGLIDLRNTGSLVVDGTLAAPGQLMRLAAGTGITGVGALTAATLEATTASGDIVLSGANVVGQLSAVAANGSIVFNDTVETLTTQLVQAGGDVALANSGAILVAGSGVAGRTVSFAAGTGISGAASVTADRLNARTAAGDIRLSAGFVGTLGTIVAPGRVDFVNVSGPLTVESVTAGTGIDLAAAFLDIPGSISSPGQLVVLRSGGMAGTGAITAGTLEASGGGGGIFLTGANRVDRLTQFTATGDAAFNNTTPSLAVDGAILVGGDASISQSGALLLNTTVTVGGTLALAAASIAGPGPIASGTLFLSASGGDISLTGANRVGRLGGASTPGNLAFNNDIDMVVPEGAVVRAGGVADIAGAGSIVIDGTVSGATLTVQAANLLAVNGFSAISRDGPLFLSGDVVTVTGLIAAATEIVIDAGSANLGGRATGQTLSIRAPAIAFNGLDAGGMQVNLFLGTAGVANGTLDAGGLLVAGGSGVTLFGTLAGISGGAAAIRGVRADANGTPFVGAPPTPDVFTLNDCPIGVAVCQPLLVAPVTVATNPLEIMRQLDPRRYAVELTDSFLLLPRPRNLNLLSQPSRDSGEDLDLAPPNVRAEDY